MSGQSRAGWNFVIWQSGNFAIQGRAGLDFQIIKLPDYEITK
jgi:hypothetical protein